MRRVIVADTHTWLWWVGDYDELSDAAFDALQSSDRIGVCPMSFWELAMLAHRHRIELEYDTRAWLRNATSIAKIEVLPITINIAATGATLPRDVVADPADRLIVATAIEHRVPLVTKDGRIRRSGLVETIW